MTLLIPSFRRSAAISLLVTQNGLKDTSDLGLVVSLVVNDSVRASVESVCGDRFSSFGVDHVDHANGSTRSIVHVENRGLGVEASSVERVAVLHGEAGESGKVLVGNGLLHLLHAAGHGVCDALGEKSRGCNGLLHTRSAADVLLLGRCNENDGTHV
ncbi:MVD1, mevalonate pyrophosphate decarboxylase, partial [Aureobasidium melanogenum]